jgi:hypothetical protein
MLMPYAQLRSTLRFTGTAVPTVRLAGVHAVAAVDQALTSKAEPYTPEIKCSACGTVCVESLHLHVAHMHCCSHYSV